jgi:hypothetical protein
MKYFKSGVDWEFNARLTREDNIWLYYGEGYRLAAELIVNKILCIDRTDEDFLIYPYCYLMRHYIELRLKEIIEEGNKLLGNKVDPAKDQHFILKLWETAQSTLKSLFTTSYSKPDKELVEFIKEFDYIDMKTQAFRYPIDGSKKQTLSLISEINFKDLFSIFDKIKYYLETLTDGIAGIKDSFQ